MFRRADTPDLFTYAEIVEAVIREVQTPPPTRHDLPEDYEADLVPLGLDSVPGWLHS